MILSTDILEDTLIVLRNCSFLGPRAAKLAEDLLPYIEDEIESRYAFSGQFYDLPFEG